MSSVDSLPPDQRAVLQMVLQRGYSYDDIAALLSIDRASVRRRALDALDALGPTNSIPAPQRALLTDYLLGQLPERVAEQVRQQLGRSPSDRAWARVISAQVGDLSNVPLPEIPIGPNLPDEPPAARAAAWAALADEHLAATGAVPAAPGTREPEAPEPQPPVLEPEPLAPVPEPLLPEPEPLLPEPEPLVPEPEPWAVVPEPEPLVPEPEPWAVVPEPEPLVPEPEPLVPEPEPWAVVPEPEPSAPEPAVAEPPVARAGKRELASGGGSLPPSGSSGGQWTPASPISEPEARTQRSSRLGGIIVLAVLAIVVVVILVLLLNSGGGKNKSHTTGAGQSTTTSTPTQTTVTTPTTTTSSTPASTETVVRQVNLYPPKGGAAHAAGVADVVKVGRTLSIVIIGQDMPAANTVSRAYAVWLDNSPSSAELLGFVDQSVRAHGTLKVESLLPANASRYKHLLVTLETKRKPTVPGKVVLTGAFGT